MRVAQSAKVSLLSVSALMGCTVHHHYPAAPVPSVAADEDSASECAPLLPAPDALAGHEVEVHGHSHAHRESEVRTPTSGARSADARVISHAELENFENDGALLVGLATAGLGAQNFEIWRSSVPKGGSTPVHVHDTEEIFVLLRGKGKLLVGDREIAFEAPATVIAPAHVPHQLVNTGEIATDQIVVVGIGSEIKNEHGKVMELPWRK